MNWLHRTRWLFAWIALLSGVVAIWSLFNLGSHSFVPYVAIALDGPTQLLATLGMTRSEKPRAGYAVLLGWLSSLGWIAASFFLLSMSDFLFQPVAIVASFTVIPLILCAIIAQAFAFLGFFNADA